MNANFPICLKATLIEEGGWANVPGDTGGPTMAGVTQAVWSSWCFKNKLPVTSVKNSTAAQREQLYRDDFWRTVRGDVLPAGVDMSIFDASVNSGPSRALKLQIASGNTTDVVAFIKRYTDNRLAFMHAIRGGSAWAQFGKGWGRRCGRIEAQSIKLATAGRTTQSAVLSQNAERATATATETKQKTRTAAAATTTVGGTGAVVATDPKTTGSNVGVYVGVAVLIVVVVAISIFVERIASGRADAAQQAAGVA